MPLADIALDEITYVESETLIHVKADAIIELRPATVDIPISSTVIDALKTRDVWCSRSFALELGMRFQLGVGMSWSKLDVREWIAQLCQLLQNAQIWHSLGLKIQFRHTSLPEQDCTLFTICIELSDITSRSLGAYDNLVPTDLTNVRPPGTILAYDLKSVNITWQFSVLPHEEGPSKYINVYPNTCRVVSNNIIISSVKCAIQRVLGLDRIGRSSIQKQSVPPLLDLAPAIFMRGYAERIHQRTHLLGAATSFLAKFDRYGSTETYNETAKDISKKAISHNLWMTMANSLKMEGLGRRPSTVWWTETDPPQKSLYATRAVSTIDQNHSDSDNPKPLDIGTEAPDSSPRYDEHLIDNLFHPCRMHAEKCFKQDTDLTKQPYVNVDVTLRPQYYTNSRDDIILDKDLFGKEHYNTNHDFVGIEYLEDMNEVLSHGSNAEMLVDSMHSSSIEDDLFCCPATTFVHLRSRNKDGHDVTYTLHGLADGHSEDSPSTDASVTESYMLQDLNDICSSSTEFEPRSSEMGQEDSSPFPEYPDICRYADIDDAMLV